MGRIGKIIAHLTQDINGAKAAQVEVDPGAGANITAQQFGPPGDDSQPLGTDYVVVQDVPGAGRTAAVGFADPKTSHEAGPGETRRYSRDADGQVVAQHWLKSSGEAVTEALSGGEVKASVSVKPDGTFSVTNDTGTTTYNADGSVLFANGAQMTPDGDYITPDNISLRLHKHIGNLGSPTGPAIP